MLAGALRPMARSTALRPMALSFARRPMALSFARRLAALSIGLASTAAGSAQALSFSPCWLHGHPLVARCASVTRPLDPGQPQGRQVEIHFAVVPALARQKAPDPVVFLVGGPGQSAIDLAGTLAGRFSRLGQRRDLVFVDQRGSGRSAPLKCADDSDAAAWQPLIDEAQRLARLRGCRQALQALPWGDLRQFSTAIASADLDAVRVALGVDRINLIGFSYGSRAALDYQRQFPAQVRRTVLDGVVPPWMALSRSASADNQAALDKVFDECERSPTCRARHPDLRQQWHSLLASLPRRVTVVQPLSGLAQTLDLSRSTVLGLVRAPLYAPALAAALPPAIEAAAHGRLEPLLGLASGLGGGGLASGMHFSLQCSEDAAETSPAGPADGTDFGDSFARLYAAVCADWPRAAIPAAFYTLPAAQTPVLLLSGGADPVTPPAHARAAAQALGAKARELVVAQAGHGLLALGCLREAAVDFIQAESDAAALATPLDCASQVPAARVFAAPAAVAKP